MQAMLLRDRNQLYYPESLIRETWFEALLMDRGFAPAFNSGTRLQASDRHYMREMILQGQEFLIHPGALTSDHSERAHVL
jgi:hypothetical protein